MTSIDLTRTEKTCSHCHETKPIDQFRIKIKATGARQARCIACQKIASRAHYEANQADVIAKSRVRKTDQKAILRDVVAAELEGKSCVKCDATENLTFVVNNDYAGPRVSAAVAGGMAVETVMDSIQNSTVQCTCCMRKAGIEHLHAWLFLKNDVGIEVPPNPFNKKDYKERNTKSIVDRRGTAFRGGATSLN